MQEMFVIDILFNFRSFSSPMSNASSRMETVSTTVSLCLGTFKLALVQTSSMFQCVQTTAMLGLRHAKMTGHVLSIGGGSFYLRMVQTQIAAHQILPAAHFKMYMETVEACVIAYGEMKSFTPLTVTTAQ